MRYIHKFRCQKCVQNIIKFIGDIFFHTFGLFLILALTAFRTTWPRYKLTVFTVRWKLTPLEARKKIVFSVIFSNTSIVVAFSTLNCIIFAPVFPIQCDSQIGYLNCIITKISMRKCPAKISLNWNIRRNKSRPVHAILSSKRRIDFRLIPLTWWLRDGCQSAQQTTNLKYRHVPRRYALNIWPTRLTIGLHRLEVVWVCVGVGQGGSKSFHSSFADSRLQ